MKTLSLRALGAATIIALLGTTACSTSNDTAAFCNFATDVDLHLEAFDDIELTQDVLAAAGAGDMVPLNDWGQTAGDAIDEIIAGLNDARDAAPDEEAEEALTWIIEATGALRGMATAAQTANSAEEFIEGADAATAEFEELEQQAGDPDAVLEAKATEYCEE